MKLTLKQVNAISVHYSKWNEVTVHPTALQPGPVVVTVHDTRKSVNEDRIIDIDGSVIQG